MEAIVKIGGHQYMVKTGQKLTVNRLPDDVGAEVSFDVLALLGDKPQVGQPTVKGAKVTAKVIKHKRGDKLMVSTYKRRKGYHKTHGHRQELTDLEISAVK